MGISGLLPFLKKASRPASAREFRGQTAAVDVYCWLHKGAFGCAEKLVLGQPTDGYVLYVMKYVDMLLREDVKPVLVFDGRNLPSKAGTERKRRENRAKYKEMAREYLREGRHREARECFQRCVDVTPEMAGDVIRACTARNVDCVVAPYEADAQLAHLCNSGVADFVISEDSDLTLFGCNRILFKLDSSGNGVLYERDKLPLCFGPRAADFDLAKFRRMCITSGCDYLPSLHGVGLGKALKFWSKVSDPELSRVLKRIPAYLNMSGVKVDKEYVDGFIQAEKTFLYQIVFDTRTRKSRPLTDYPPDENLGDLSFAGERQEDDEVALQMALGNLNVRTKQRVSNFDPDDVTFPQNDTKYGKRTKHLSIWSRDFDPRSRDPPLTEEEAEEAARKKRREEGVVQTAFGDLSVKRKSKEGEQLGGKRRRAEVQRVDESEEEDDDDSGGLIEMAAGYSQSSGKKRRRVEVGRNVREKEEGSEWGGREVTLLAENSPKFSTPKCSDKNRRGGSAGEKASSKVVVHSRYFTSGPTLEKMNSVVDVTDGDGPPQEEPRKAPANPARFHRETGLDECNGGDAAGDRGDVKKVLKAGDSAKKGEESPAGKSPPQSGGKRSSWLDCLDDAADVSRKVIYNTDFIAKDDEEEEGSESQTGKGGGKTPGKGIPRLPPLSKTELRSTESSRQAFKPVAVSRQSTSAQESDEAKKRRNPFAITSPPKKVEVETSSQGSSTFSSPPKSASFSQASIDRESFRLGVDDPDSQRSTSSSQEENRNPISTTSTSKSAYFTSPKILTKAKAIAPSKKKKSPGVRGQRSILDLWAKR